LETRDTADFQFAESILDHQFRRPATRGEGQGEGLLIKHSNDFNTPPLPNPLLHFMEEREKNYQSVVRLSMSLKLGNCLS
jgi:hypothetical protein